MNKNIKIVIALVAVFFIGITVFFYSKKFIKPTCLNNNGVASYENDKSDFVGKITVNIKNKRTEETIFSFPINDVMLRNYNPAETHNCGIYVMRSFGDDYSSSKTLPGFSKELWFYSYKGIGKKVISLAGENQDTKKPEVYYSYNFRIDSKEKYLVLQKGIASQDDYSIIIKTLSDKKDVFTIYAKELFQKYPNIVGDLGLKKWTSDGKYFWGDISSGADVYGFFRIDTQNWSYEVFSAPTNVLGGDALNVEKGLITVHPGNVWYGFADAEAEEKAIRRQQGIGTELYIHNLFTKEKILVDKTDEPLYFFKPEWLSDTQLQYEMSNSEKKIYTISTSAQKTQLREEKINEISYFLNSNGELFKKMPYGETVGLVTFAADMQNNFVKDDWSDNEVKLYPYTKGKVLEYWVSPDGNHIAYLIQDGLTSCCMSPPTRPSTRLQIMKKDGSSKILIDKSLRGAPIVEFDGWLPNSQGFVFHDTFPDEATQGSPFYLGNVNNPQYKLFDAIDYNENEPLDTYVVTTALAEPHFSPKQNLMVYRKGGIFGQEIILSHIDGGDKKVIMTLKNGEITKIEWSQEEEIIVVVEGEDHIVYKFDSTGKEIFKGN